MFIRFKRAVQAQFDIMKKHPLFRTTADKNAIWDLYLASFPEGSNPVFRERTEHDCNCCKSFIRAVGNVVAIIDGKVVSIWDHDVNDPNYTVVSKALAEFVKSHPIDNVFLTTEPKAGVDKSYEVSEFVSAKTWEHFYVEIPREFVLRNDAIGPKLSDTRATHDVLLRGLEEISLEDVDTILDLIAQNSLYRGEEHKFLLTEFRKLKAFYMLLSPEARGLFVWRNVVANGPSQAVLRIRNTVIGTILVDLAEGKELEQAVKAYEAKVAPTNYKRPTALVSKKMIEDAKKTIEELGYMGALERRHAVVEDLTINNVLFADRTAKKAMDVFDELVAKVPDGKAKTFDKVEEIHIDKFVAEVLPKAESIELMFENKHTSNLVSLVAPKDKEAKGMFKWPNNFSWSYSGELADSIKERVKAAGGKVDGDLRCSLSWFNRDDLDLHMREPNAGHIWFNHMRGHQTGGELDVDMNRAGETRTPVENIVYADRRRMVDGEYTLKVHQYRNRERIDPGFEVEIEFDGQVHTFVYPKTVAGYVTVATIKFDKKTGTFSIKSDLESSTRSKEVWGINTQKFHKVQMVLNSPNHWDGHQVGNKHYFFVLDGCTNPEPTRGFFNEFLDEDLNKHRKVLEVLGSKLKVEPAENQLSGLGFSSTQHTDIVCKVNGSFSRMLKITV